MAEIADAAEVAVRIVTELEAAGVPHAIGGAIAFGFYGPPRATNDVDVNVFLPEDRAGEIFAVLERAGCVIDRDHALRSARERGDFIARFRGMRVDVFLSSIPLSESAAGRLQVFELLDRNIHVLSAEDLVLFKLLFFRPKDLQDIERLVALQGGALDRGYVRRWLVDMLGGQSDRVAAWDAIAARHR